MFSYNKNVTWVYRGVEQEIMSHRDFNSLISRICDEVYYNTPIMNNELFNKHKLSSQITSAKAKYLKALVGNNDEIDLGFDPDKFPPEKRFIILYCGIQACMLRGDLPICPIII